MLSASLVKNLSTDPRGFFQAGAKLLFEVSDHSDSYLNHLFVTDGTESGTAFVLGGGVGPPAVRSDGTAFVVSSSEAALYETNGTPGSAVRVADNTNGPIAIYKNLAFFGGTPFTPVLKSTDGTASGTSTLEDGYLPTDMLVANGLLYFLAFDPNGTDRSLWRTDGTAAGTSKVAEIPGGQIGEMQAAAGGVFFTNTVFGKPDRTDLWYSDGSSAGTRIVGSFSPVTVGHSSAADDLISMGNFLYFQANDPVHKGSLWRSDGTLAGTTIVVPDLWDMSQGDSFPYFARLGNTLFFAAHEPSNPYVSQWGNTLWTSDGTAAGTQPVPRNVPFSEGRWPSYLLAADGHVFFSATGFDGGVEVWRSDGTGNGTLMLANQIPPPQSGNQFPAPLAVFNGMVFFWGVGSSNGRDLWKVPETDTPPVATVEAVSPQPHPGPIDQLTITFNEPVTGLTLADISLTRNDSPNLLTGQQTLTSSDQVHWTLGGLAEITGQAGKYTIDVRGIGSGIRDASGDAPLADAIETFAIVPPPASISGLAFSDDNHNAVRDDAENGLAGITVFLDTNDDEILDSGEVSTVTDASGAYHFDNLPAGVYLVREIVPPGWRRTTPLLTESSVYLSGQSVEGPTFGNSQVKDVPLDFEYLLALAQHYSGPGTFATGDLNGDDKVDFSDLLILAQHYGQVLPASTPAARSTRRR